MTLEDASKTRQAFILAAVCLIGFVVLYAVAEIGVRVRHYIKYGGLWGVEDTYIVDPKSGLRIPKPIGHFGAITINSRGFRGPEIAMPKPAGTVRIAFLGASTTYCAEVSSNDAVWPQLVTAGLQQHWPNVTFDFINAGVPGYTASTSLKNLRTRVAPLDPDIIVIYHGTNDLSANSFDLAKREGVVTERSEQKLSTFSHYSLLWYLLEKNLMVVANQAQSDKVTGKITYDEAALTKPFEADLRALVAASQKTAQRVYIATFATQMRKGQPADRLKQAAVTSLFYMPYMTLENLLAGFAAYNRVIDQVAADSGAVLIGGEDTIPGDPAHFADSVHFTDAGSRIMARRVLDAMTGDAALTAFINLKATGN